MERFNCNWIGILNKLYLVKVPLASAFSLFDLAGVAIFHEKSTASLEA